MAALTFPEIAATGPAVADGPIRFGSEEHKQLFCKTLLDTFNPYRPAVIDWPKLDDEAKARITALPIWDIAVQTENRASLNVCTYAEGVNDAVTGKYRLDCKEKRTVYRLYNNRFAQSDSNHRYVDDVFLYEAMQAQGWKGISANLKMTLFEVCHILRQIAIRGGGEWTLCGAVPAKTGMW